MEPSRSVRTGQLADAASEEDTRAHIQHRLAVLWKMMFWAFVILAGSQGLIYEVLYPSLRPVHQTYVYLAAGSGLVIMAFIWRGLLARRPLSLGQLFGIDMFFGAGCGTLLGGAALITYSFLPSHYVCLMYASFAVLARALLVPSSTRWTVLMSTVTLVPVMIAAALLALFVDVLIPGPIFFSFALLLGGVAVLLAATGSRIIYGLRREVRAARRIGRYTLDRKLGEGGMGEVYRAHHVILRRPTAVKLLRPDRVGAETLERFEREVQTTSQLTHPNIVAVYDYGHTSDGVFYYAMEYLGGGIDLENLVRAHGPQPPARVVHILAQVCGALQDAHDNHLVHRDIKPANIILCERGGQPDVVKVVDFGLVKQITADTSASAQVILGTPAYVAPETITANTIGTAVDLYALGAVGYFLLTGRRVFEGKTAVDVCIQHVTTPPKRPSEVAAIDVPPELEAVVLRCLEKQPGARYASALEMAAALRAIPASRDWDEVEARRWWRDFRDGSRDAEAAADAAGLAHTQTIPVDLGERGTGAPAP